MKRVCGFVVFVVLVVALPAGSVLRVDSVRAEMFAVPSRCSNIQLVIQPRSSQGAAGSGAVIYRLHNMSGRACTLKGYPGVQLLDRNFQTLPTTVYRGARYLVGAIPPTLVTIRPSGNAYFALGYSDVPVNGRCEAQARYVMIIPPDDYLPDVTYAFTRGGGITSCTGTISVTPITSTPRYR